MRHGRRAPLAADRSYLVMNEYLEISYRLLIALGFGGLVGLERSYHGRPAGFRTHTLVCLGSALLMLVTVYEGQWFVSHGMERVSIDPTRMAQGIMTGIGFLGAGVIMKEGFSISGLTTAASIWTSAAIGILVGVGFHAAAILMALMSVACMMWVSKLEGWLPSRQAVAIMRRFRKGLVPREDVLRRVARERRYDIAAFAIGCGRTYF